MRLRPRLRTELLLTIALAAALPLSVFATFATFESRRALKDALLDRQAKVADERAEALSRELNALQRAMRQMLAGNAFEDPSPAAVQASLTELFLKKDAISQVALLRADGKVASTLFVDDPAAFERVRPEFSRHPVLTGKQAEAFVNELNGTAVTERDPDTLVLQSDPEPGKKRLAMLVKVSALARGLIGDSDDGQALLVDRRGKVVAGDTDVGRTAPQLGLDEPLRLSRIEWSNGPALAARAKVRGTEFSVAVLRPESDALAPLSRLSWVTAGLLGLTLLTALVVGLLLSRQLSRPIARLAEGANELAAGNLDHRIERHRVSELDDVARAFNDMAETLHAANARLVGFNEELQKQVAERTRELRDAQAQLLRSQRLGAVIDLTSGLAHELNNPLAAIIGTAQLVQIELPANDPMQARLQPIVTEGLRISRLLKRITALSDWERGNLTEANMNPLIDEALAEHERKLREAHAEVVRAFDPRLPPVLADAPAMREVVGHLIENARQALEGRPARQIRVSTRAVEGAAVRVDISDTGRGIPRQHLERIFNPFFSTESGKRGAGLSLARCHQVVQAHGGKLTVESQEGVGTTVSLVLPAAPPRAQLV
ncbi:MAG: ATP-binding protein [Myxococcaceae bacterium]